MNYRRKLLIALGAGAFTAPLASFAQQTGAIPQVGLLWIDTDSSSKYVVAFREGLKAHGYIEAKNIRIDDRSLVDRYELLSQAADRLVRQKVDVIVCYGATALQTASKATTTIPIVMVMSGDPVKLGVVKSLSRPGGNVTGTSSISQELAGKRIQLLKEIVPRIRSFAVILYPESKAEIMTLRNSETAARALNLKVRSVEVRTPDEIGSVISGIARMNVQAIMVVGSTMLTANRESVVAAVEKLRLPAIYPNSDFPRVGGLMSYAPDNADGFRQVATYVDKILKGTKPADIPVEQPTKLELIVNMKTAKALGIKIPDVVLMRADTVIE